MQATEVVAIVFGLIVAYALGYLNGKVEERRQIEEQIRRMFEPPRRDRSEGDELERRVRAMTMDEIEQELQRAKDSGARGKPTE